MCMTESIPCSPETITTLLIGYTPIQKKKFKEKKRCDIYIHNRVLLSCKKKKKMPFAATRMDLEIILS